MNTVLVVDDHPLTRTFIRSALERRGWVVLEADDQMTACEAVRDASQAVTVALIDIELPGPGGSAIARSLQSMQQVPVLFMSGYDRDDLVAQGKLESGAHMLTKPFTVQSLLTALDARIPPDRP
jgi:DNA-binding response OmpR family regulator